MGAILTPKNNNPDKKSANNADSYNPDFDPDSNNVNDSNVNFNTDYNNPDNLCKLLNLIEFSTSGKKY